MRNQGFRNVFVAISLMCPVVGIHAQWALSNLATTANGRVPVAASLPTSVPALVPFSAAAVDSEGKPLTGEASATFLIYKDQQGGEPLFTESQILTFDETGHYKVQLGAANASGLPSALFLSGEARWLEVQIAGQPTEPRILLASVPYALKAADSATLGGLPPSAFARASSTGVATTNSSAITPDVTTTAVTTTGGQTGTVAAFSGASSIATPQSGILYTSLTNGGLGIGRGPAAALDVLGQTIFRGGAVFSRSGEATTAAGKPSFQFQFQTSVWNSHNGGTLIPNFTLQTEPTGNNTANTGATLNFLYYSGVGSTPSETGLYINPNGSIHFSPSQTFPGGPGAGTITGVTAGTGLTGGGTTGVVALNVDSTKVPLLANANTFVGNQAITGNATVSGELGVGTTSPEGLIDVEGNAGQLILVNATGPGDWAINSFGGGDGGLAGRFVAGSGTGSNAGGGGIAVGGGSTSGTGAGGVGASISGGYSYSGSGGDGVDVTAGNYEYGTGEGYAGNFTGDVRVSGTLYAGAKSFSIDHPLDPANKYLNHTSTESSEMMNIYSGNVTTDGNGLSTVSLPDWFETVNTDFRYQLTVVGQFAQAIIKSKIAGGHFTIMTNAPNVEVSWMITAVRQDAYAKAHPMVVEQAKPANERGYYIHPELYGQPMEKQTEWGRHPQQMQQMKNMRSSQNAGMNKAEVLKP